MPVLDIPNDLQPLTQNMAIPADLQPVTSSPQDSMVNRIAATEGKTPAEQDAIRQSLAAQMAHPISGDPIMPPGMSIKPVEWEGESTVPSPVAGTPQETSGIANAVAAGVSSWADPLANLLIRGGERIGLVSPDRAQAAINYHPMPSDTNRISGKIGAGIGLAGEAIASGPAAPLLIASQGAEQATENIEAQAQQGQTASQSGQIADVAGHAALNYVMGRLAPGQKLNSQIVQGMMPELRNVAANAVKNTLTSAGVHVGEGYAFQVADNAITKYTGVNPNQSFTEGAAENALTQGVMGGVGQGLHEILPSGAKHTAESPAPVNHEQPVLDEVQQQVTDNHDTIKANNRLLSPDHPTELADSSAVGDWYRNTFAKGQGAEAEQNAGAIESMASMNPGKFVLRDVPVDQLSSPNLTGDETNQTRVSKYAGMDPETQPPSIAIKMGNKLAIIDGKHRLEAAQQRGDATMPAYVPESFAKTLDAAPAAPKQSLLAGLLSDESGKDTSIQNFAQKSVLPEAKTWWAGMKGTWKNVNRFIGSGLGETSDEGRVGGAIRSSLGEQDLDRIRTEQQFKPHRDVVEGYSDAQKTQWVEAMESGKNSPDPRTQGAFDFMRRLNAKNKQDAAAVGIDTTKWDSNDDWVGRMAVFPGEKGGPGSSRSIAGSENYLKGRVFKTYGEFKQAVEAAGGKMRYDNPIDVVVAKQAEIRKSIEARKIVTDEMARGTVQKLKPGQNLPEGYQYLDDRLARKMTKAQLWTDKQGNPNMRPAPRLIAPDPIASKLNQFIAPGLSKTLPIWSKIVEMKRNSVAINFALSAFHVPIEAVSNASISVGQALDNAMHGEVGLAGKNLKRALPWEQAKFGSAIREQAKNAKFDPSLEPLVKATAQAGQRFNVRSLLDPNSFEKAKTAFKEQNPIAGSYHVLRGLGESVTSPIMEKYVPNLKAGAMGMRAETLLSRGLKSADIKKDMMRTSDNVDNMLGQVVRSNQFQHKIIQDINDGIFSAPKFTEGALRYGGSLARDTASAFRDIVQGKKPTLTPAMYTLAGYAITHATLGTAIQLAYTTATTGKAIMPTSLKDMFYPQTGRKNPDGTPERIELPDPMSFFISSYNEGPMKALGNRVSPLWRAMMDVVNNSDYRNVEVRDKEASIGTQAGQVAKHIAASQIPFSVGNALQKPSSKPETTDLKVGNLMGVRRAPASVNQSAAEAAASEIILNKLPRGSRTPEEADKSDLESSILTGIRSKDPQATTQLREGFKSGQLTLRDVEAVQKRATGPTGLLGKLQSPDVSAEDAMDGVWPKMTPEEQQKTQWVIRKKIVQAESLTPAKRKAFIDQINRDTKGAK